MTTEPERPDLLPGNQLKALRDGLDPPVPLQRGVVGDGGVVGEICRDGVRVDDDRVGLLPERHRGVETSTYPHSRPEATYRPSRLSAVRRSPPRADR